MTVAPPYTGPVGPAPTPGLATLAQICRWIYATTGHEMADLDPMDHVRHFQAFLVGQGPPTKPLAREADH